MSLDYTTAETGVISDVFSTYAEQNIDADINLPDYCPDILRVLKCSVEPCIISSKISGDRINTDGNAYVRVIYADENNNICTYEQPYPFSKYVETGGDKTGALFTSADVQYVNCRAVNKRRLEMHAMIRLSVKICDVEKMQVVDCISDDCVQAKMQPVEFSNITACECKLFPVNETAAIPEDYLPAQRIVNTSAVPVISESKVIQGKILIKGEIDVGIIYCIDNNFGECINYSYTIPVNQVLEVSGLDENSRCQVLPEILSSDFSVRNDAQNQPRLIDINLVVAAKVNAYNEECINCITDAYSICGALQTEYEQMNFYKKTESINDTFIFRNDLDFSALSPASVSAVWFDKPSLKKRISDGKIIFSGTAAAHILLTDTDNKPVYCDRDFDFEYSKSISCSDDAFISASVNVTGCSFGAVSDGSSEVRAEFVLCADVFSSMQCRALISADVISCNIPDGRIPSIVVYFSDCDESVWDIARKYSTTVQLIKKENNLSSDILPCGSPVLIPVI